MTEKQMIEEQANKQMSRQTLSREERWGACSLYSSAMLMGDLPA
jgi:hypothetical protein